MKGEQTITKKGKQQKQEVQQHEKINLQSKTGNN